MSLFNPPLMVKCPTCRRAVSWTAEQLFKPFCSERCRLIDLGEWAMEEKRIPGASLLQESDNDDDVFFQ
jgi:uncharacterized protein